MLYHVVIENKVKQANIIYSNCQFVTNKRWIYNKIIYNNYMPDWARCKIAIAQIYA